MITYEIDRVARLVTCHVTDSLRALDVANFIERLWQNPDFQPDFSTLVGVDEATVTPDVVARNALAELLLSWRKLHLAAKWALVLPGSAWQRIATQLIGEYDLASRNVSWFPDVDSALSWLQPAEAAEVTR